MQTPGAAMSTSAPKLLKLANVSSLAAARRPLAARRAVSVGEGGDGDHFLVGGRHRGRRIAPLVAGGDDDRDPGLVDDPADRAVQGIGVTADAVGAIATQAQVDDVDRAAVGVDPVEPTDDRGKRSVPRWRRAP